MDSHRKHIFVHPCLFCMKLDLARAGYIRKCVKKGHSYHLLHFFTPWFDHKSFDTSDYSTICYRCLFEKSSGNLSTLTKDMCGSQAMSWFLGIFRKKPFLWSHEWMSNCLSFLKCGNVSPSGKAHLTHVFFSFKGWFWINILSSSLYNSIFFFYSVFYKLKLNKLKWCFLSWAALSKSRWVMSIFEMHKAFCSRTNN